MGSDETTDNKQGLTDPDSKMLTPWQEANISYLKEHGLEPEEVVATEVDLPVTEKKQEDEQLDSEEKPIENEQEAAAEPEVPLRRSKDLPKSKSFADKLPKMKEARQKRLKKRLTLLVSLFGVTALGMIYYVSPLSKLSQIEIVGNQAVTKNDIAKATKLTSHDFIWSAYFDKEVIPNIKKANPRISTVTVNLSHFNNLKYTVTEFSEIAYAKDDQVFHPVLENGAILNEVTEIKNEQFPILIDFKEGDSLNNLMTHFKDIEEGVKTNIKEVRSTPEERNPFLVRFIMKDGNEILASTQDFQEKINYYPQVLAEMDGKGVVDMEAGVYWKSFETLVSEKEAEEAEKERAEWLKTLEDENTEKNNE